MNIVYSNFALNPITEEKSNKIEAMKEAQEEKRASLFSILQEQRAIYKDSKAECAKYQRLFLEQQKALKADENNAQVQAKYNKAKSIFTKASNNSDLQLSLLQHRTDSYCRAARVNFLDLA